MEAKNAEKIYLENQQLRGTELFQSLGGAERQEAFMRFLSAYAANKIRMLGRSKRPHSAAKSDKSIREHEAAGIKFEDAVNNRAKLNELTAEQEAWRNVGTHPELIEEAKSEFDKTAEGAQQYLDFGNFSIQPQQKALREQYRAERQRAGKLNKNFTKKLSQIVEKRKDVNGKNVWALTKKSKYVVEVCPYPFILNHVKPWQGNVVVTAHVVQKLLNKHNLTLHDVGQLPSEVSDPIVILQEIENNKIVFITDIRSKNNRGETKHTKVILHLRKTKQGIEIADVKSAYSSDHHDSFYHAINKGRLLYVDKQRALGWTATEGKPISQLLQTVLSNKGSTVILKENVINVNIFPSGSANFSIAALSPGDRFPGNPLAVRMSNYLRREAKRFARVLGDKTPHDTAVNAINSARSVIGMLDKYVHTNAIPISRDARNRLNLLQRIIEKYAQIIEKGSKRTFNQISKEEQGVLDAIVEEMGAALETGQTKETAKARYKELIRMAAKGRVWQLLSEMMTEAGNLVDIYLKNELLQKLKRVTNTVKLKRSKSGKLKGKMGAADYRRMDTVVQLMGMSARAKDNALGQIEGARLLLQSRKNELPDTGVNELIDEIRNELKAQGKEATMEDVYMALNNREADLLTFADIESMDYDQTRKAANALATLISVGRAKWEQIQQEKYEKIKAFLDHFYKHTCALHGTSQENDKATRRSIGDIFNSSMSDAQLLFALGGHEALRPVMDELRRNLATAQDARTLHIKSITNQIYAIYARLIGMQPQTEAGFTAKQLSKASDKLSMEFEKWNQTAEPGIVRKWMKDGKLLEQKMELTRLQALDIILTYRQPHYQPNAAAHGYTEEVLNKLEEFCGTRLMATILRQAKMFRTGKLHRIRCLRRSFQRVTT